jgi:hypothetical protein
MMPINAFIYHFAFIIRPPVPSSRGTKWPREGASAVADAMSDKKVAKRESDFVRFDFGELRLRRAQSSRRAVESSSRRAAHFGGEPFQ